MNALITTPSTALTPTNMDEAIRLAKAMSSARLVPKHLQDDVGSCLLVVEQAMRWRMSPFAVAQCTSVIGGKIMWEGKLVAAAVESSGAIEGHFDYAYSGEGDDRSVTVSARRVGETNPRQLTIHLRDVRTSNEWWKKQPDQQLAYSGVRNWARRYTPAALLGVYAPEEFDRRSGQVIDNDGPVIEAETPASPEREALNAAVPLKAAAAAMPRAPRRSAEGEDADRREAAEAEAARRAKVVDPTVYDAPKPTRTRGQFLDALSIALNDAKSHEEANKILLSEDVQRARETFTNGLKERLDGLVSRALNKWWSEPPAEEELPEIVGEEHAAG